MPESRRCPLLSVGCLAVVVVLVPALVWAAAALDAAKRYHVMPFEGRDLVCEHYTFSAEEDPLAVYQQKGEISQADFARFLRILRQINPNLANPLQPQPGESVLLPLRFETLERSTGEARSLDVPMLAIPNASAEAQDVSVQPAAASHPSRLEHVVQPGENLFRIVLRYFGTSDWQKRVEQILELNPNIGGVNRLRAGERIVLVSSGPDRPRQLTEGTTSESSNGFLDLLKAAALRLKARLFASGDLYFPKEDGGDYRLDLRRYPMLEIPRKPKMFIDTEGRLKDEGFRWIQGYWKDAAVVVVPSGVRNVDMFVEAVNSTVRGPGAAGDDSAAQQVGGFRKPKLDAWGAGRVFGIDSRDPKRAIEQLLKALGLRLQRSVQLSFPYAGAQIETVCDLVELPSRKPLIIDFGEFGGDAAAALKTCGFEITSFSAKENGTSMMRRMLKELCAMEPDRYRVGPFIEEGGAGAVDRIDLLPQHRAILLLVEPVPSDRIENWLRDGFDVVWLDDGK